MIVQQIGSFSPVEFKNRCCEDKGIRLMHIFHEIEREHVYNCVCECGGWITSGHRTPVEAIMEYERMCRTYPDEIEYNDSALFEKYIEYYTE